MSREPQRTCIGCGRVTGQSSLVRVSARPDGTGRGAWLCAGPERPVGAGKTASEACFDQAAGRNAFSRALRTDLPHGEIAALRARLLGS